MPTEIIAAGASPRTFADISAIMENTKPSLDPGLSPDLTPVAMLKERTVDGGLMLLLNLSTPLHQIKSEPTLAKTNQHLRAVDVSPSSILYSVKVCSVSSPSKSPRDGKRQRVANRVVGERTEIDGELSDYFRIVVAAAEIRCLIRTHSNLERQAMELRAQPRKEQVQAVWRS